MIENTDFFAAFIALLQDLSQSLPAEQRYQRILQQLKRLFPCDACALLKLEREYLVPLAIEGLTEDTLGRRFLISQQPRLSIILANRHLVRFAADSPLPDPYDGLIENSQQRLHVHDCMGISLWLDQQIWGVLTLDALNAGQFDHLNQPALQTFIALTEASIKAAQWIMGLETQVKQVQQTLLTEASRWEIVGKSPIIQALREEIAVVAPSELSVLILGETGVGKELVAHQIHATSHRANQPLIYVNCAALPETIAESELFGHRKGSFSGAIQDRSGKFELAHRGTIFLDEIGELPLALQAKILRTLQNGEIQRVGCDRQIKVDIRVIAATNRHLQESVAKGLFRPDLYHRLAVYPLTVPPLKQRGQDILLLAGLFLEKNKQRLGVQGLRLEIEAKNALLNYSWPGNIRELEHLLSRAALKAVAEHEKNKTIISISLKHLDIDIQNLFDTDLMIKNNPIVDQTLNFKAQRDEFSRQLIQQQLALHQHNLAKTAYALGLNPGNFHRLLKRLHLL